MKHELYEYLRSEMIKNKNEEKIEKAESYLRNKFKCLGLNMAQKKAVYKDIIAKENNQEIDWQLVNLCFEDEYRDVQYIACYYLAHKQKQLTIDDIDKLKKLVQTKSWWDTVDSLDVIIGDIGLRDESLNDIMLDWSKDEDFWLRRVAIDHQLLRKDKTNQELLAKIIINNFGSDEFFINKAIGWALRAYSKTNKEWVKNFIHQYQDQMHKLSIKEASKYLDK